MAGRFAFAARSMFRRYGRAMVRPIYRQQYHPLKGGRASKELVEALQWWAEVMELDISERFELDAKVRPHVQLLSDAAGNNGRLAAVLIDEHGVAWHTAMDTPAEWAAWFVERTDKQILGLELLSVILGLETFRKQIEDKNITIYTDNTGTESILIRGSAKSPDHNVIAHLFWKRAAEDRLGVWVSRVGTDDNIADGPTRWWNIALDWISSKLCKAKLPKGGRL